MNPLIWQKRLRPLLTPVSLLYRRILAARRAKWENEGSPAFRPACPCVSVGNIAWGGTGQNPRGGLAARLERGAGAAGGGAVAGV